MAAVVIIIGGLILLIVNVSDSFNTWYGDSGFLKVPKTFTMNLFGFFDLMNSIFSFLFLGMLVGLSKQNLAFENLGFKLMIFTTVFVFGFLPTFHFYKKYLFYKLNGNLDYTFNPTDKTLHVNDSDATTISASDISIIKSFNISGRLDFNFKIIHLKNGKEIVISSDLPFCDHFDDFFGKNVKFEYIEFSPIDLVKHLKILKSHI